LQGDLSPEEMDKLVEQEGDALAGRVIGARQMLSRVDGLLAADQDLIDEINSVIGERQLPSEFELILFLNSFLANRYPGTQLPTRAVKDVVSVTLGSQLGLAIESAASQLGHEAALFGRRISTGPVSITLSREAGYRHPRAELIHLNHPLTQFAVSEMNAAKLANNAAFALRISTSRLPPGLYGFLISLIHVQTARSITKLVALFARWDGTQVWSNPEQTNALLIEVLECGQDVESIPELREVAQVKSRLVSALDEMKRDWERRESKLEQARLEQQSGSRLAIHDFRIRRLRDRLNNLTGAGANEFAIRMTNAQLTKAEQERQVFIDSRANQAWGVIEHEEIAVGVLEVSGENSGVA
jgi:hypothetical protein